MGYNKLKSSSANRNTSVKPRFSLLWTSSVTSRYESIDGDLEAEKNNQTATVRSVGKHKPLLKHIQNELFVSEQSLSNPESESVNLATIYPLDELAKSRTTSSCQRRILCKKLARRFKKVLEGSLKFGSSEKQTQVSAEEEEEDIYVQVNQLLTNATMQEARKSSRSSSPGKTGSLSRPGHLLYSNSIHNQNLINNNLTSSQNYINNNHHHYNSSGNLSKSVDNCWSAFEKNTVNSGSDEDNSPTEMNNCRKFIDNKPPLVKRLTMALLLRNSEEYRPLMYNSQNSNLNNYKTSGSKGSGQLFGGGFTTDGYVNETASDLERIISSKFGDSCRKSLMSMTNQESSHWASEQNQEFNFKKNLLRETSSANSSPKTFSKPFRGAQHLNFGEQQELKDVSWFQAGIPRDISLEVLSKQSPGAFIVRNSNSKPGCFVLSLRVSPPLPKVVHYLILKTSRGYKIKGFTKEFTTIKALITHHSVMPELLPIPLALPRPTDLPARRNANDFDTYESLSDFQKLMTDLNDNLKLSTLIL